MCVLFSVSESSKKRLEQQLFVSAPQVLDVPRLGRGRCHQVKTSYQPGVGNVTRAETAQTMANSEVHEKS